MSGYSRTTNLTDRIAVLMAIVFLAILWFLYGKLWWWVAAVDNNQKQVVVENKILKEEVIAPSAVVQKEVEVVEEQVVAPTEVAQEELPDWYTYLLSNDYLTWSETVYTNFDSDKVITRATSTPYLARYGYLSELDIKSTVSQCTFPDVSNKTDFLKNNIIAACGYDLLRGSNWNFIPDRNMTKDELLTVLVRTKTGYLSEDIEPRFKNYFDFAEKEWLLDTGSKIAEFTWTVTKKELWQRLYKLSLVK